MAGYRVRPVAQVTGARPCLPAPCQRTAYVRREVIVTMDSISHLVRREPSTPSMAHERQTTASRVLQVTVISLQTNMTCRCLHSSIAYTGSVLCNPVILMFYVTLQ